jgi:threonine synthase
VTTFVTHLECSLTGEYSPAGVIATVSDAGKPLLVRYDLAAVKRVLTKQIVSERSGGIWRWHELLPVVDAAHRLDLGETTTPLVRLDVDEDIEAFVKDESRLPTGSFKARGLGVAVSMALELGIRHLSMPTNGNAGAAMAAYAARAGIRATVFCPADTPEVNLREMAIQGANVVRVAGLIDDCGKLVAAGREREGWFDLSTLKEPYRIEGKKTMGFELAEQLEWKLPDAIFYPTGGGTGLIGMWKAFDELEALGWIDGRRPRMYAVQADGCAPIVRAFERGMTHAERWQNASTIAAGIRVPAALGDFLILRAVRASRGRALAVSDEAILEARRRIGATQGLLLCPEGAATVAALEIAKRDGDVQAGERIVLFNCASGLKYPLPPLP